MTSKQYKGKLDKWDINKIEDEDTALSLLFGLEPESFKKFLDLIGQYSFEHDSSPYDTFAEEEKIFFVEYNDFIKKEFEGVKWNKRTLFKYIYNPYKKAKELNLWCGDFKSYTLSLYNNGFIFRPEIAKALKKLGIELVYSSDSWAIQFYKRCRTQGIWNLKLAASLYLGMSPNKKREFICLASNNIHTKKAGFALISPDTIAEYDENGKYIDEHQPSLEKYMEFGDSLYDESIESLECFVRNQIEDGNLKFVRDDGKGKLFFKPEEIVSFFKKHLPLTYQPKALYIALGLAKRSTSPPPSKKSFDDHKKIYMQYRNLQVKAYLERKIEKPWTNQNEEAGAVKKFNNGIPLNRKKFRDARNDIWSGYPGFGIPGKMNPDNDKDLREKLSKEKQVA
jgi:hypothetical protein